MKLTSPDRTARPGHPAADLKCPLGVETATRCWLTGGVIPLWLGAGLADWYRVKQTRIEDTAGAREPVSTR
jgi:hypothetical protein